MTLLPTEIERGKGGLEYVSCQWNLFRVTMIETACLVGHDTAWRSMSELTWDLQLIFADPNQIHSKFKLHNPAKNQSERKKHHPTGIQFSYIFSTQPWKYIIQPHVSWTHLLKKGLDSRLIGLGARKARWAHAYGENTSNPWTCLISMHWRITTCFVFILFLKWLKPNHPALIRIFLIFGQSDCNQMYWLFFAKCPG